MSIVSPAIRKLLPESGTPVVIGHRGASATHPENTLAAFREAFRAGAKAVELDVIPTLDGVLAVTHDFRTHAGQLVRATPFSELQGIPRLEELAAIPEGVFDIEIKSRRGIGIKERDYARSVVAAVRAMGMEERVIVRSFHPDILREVHRFAPELPIAALTGNPLHNWLRLAARTHASIISPHHRMVSRLRVKRAHRAGLLVMPWTANLPATWERLITAGVDGIITDNPAALMAYLAGRPHRFPPKLRQRRGAY